MTKSELVDRVVSKATDFTRMEMELIVNTMFDGMTNELAQNGRIEIRGFGSFKVKERKERNGRNPKSGEGIKIPSKKVPFFKVGKELKERIDK